MDLCQMFDRLENLTRTMNMTWNELLAAATAAWGPEKGPEAIRFFIRFHSSCPSKTAPR